MTGVSDLEVRARRALLDALEALGPHLDAVVLIGAQAIYLHTGDAPVALAPFTKDACYCKGIVLNYAFIRSAFLHNRADLIPFLFVGKVAHEDVAVLARRVADGVVKRLLFAFTFLILIAVDVALAGERMAALFGIDAAHPPFDVSWATGFGWVVAGGLFASVSLDLRHEVVGHPFDRLDEVSIKRLRILSDSFFVVVLISALVFYVAGSLLVAGTVPLLLVVAFMGLLGISLVAAAGLSFWAGTDSWTTLYGVALVVASYLVRLVATVPELLVLSLRRTAHFVMAAIDVPFLGAAYPLLKWWASSKFGKALGFPPLEEPIPWPPVGFLEPPAEPARSRGVPEPLALAAVLDPDGSGVVLEEAA